MAAASVENRLAGVQCRWLTGKTMGTPPLTPLEPSSLEASLSHSFSSPAASFQLRTVAPKSSTSTLSPVGSRAETRALSSEMVTWACGGRPGVAARAVGLFGRSTMVPGVWACLETSSPGAEGVGWTTPAGEKRGARSGEQGDEKVSWGGDDGLARVGWLPKAEGRRMAGLVV